MNVSEELEYLKNKIKGNIQTYKGKRFGIQNISDFKKKKVTNQRKKKKKLKRKAWEEEFPKLEIESKNVNTVVWGKIGNNESFQAKLKKKRIKKARSGKFIKRFPVKLIDISQSVRGEVQRKRLGVLFRRTGLFKKWGPRCLAEQ